MDLFKCLENKDFQNKLLFYAELISCFEEDFETILTKAKELFEAARIPEGKYYDALWQLFRDQTEGKRPRGFKAKVVSFGNRILQDEIKLNNFSL